MILSTTAIFIRFLTKDYHLPALVLAFFREIFVCLTLLVILAIFSPKLLKMRRQDRLFLLIYGAILAVFNSLWTLSVAFNGAAISTVLAYSSAAFTALLGRLIFKERLDWAKLLAVTASLAGCVLVSGAYEKAAWGANLAGIVTGILSGLLYAIYSLMGRAASQRGINPWTALLYIFAVAPIFLFGFNMIGKGVMPGAIKTTADFLWLGSNWGGWALLLFLAAGPTLAGYGLYNISLTFLPSSVANLIASTEPAFTVVIAYLFLGEMMKGVQIGGGLLIIGGVVFLRIYEGWLARKNAGEPEATGLGVIE
jgi:drug/metabolite transporter (DMT)-like permease